MANGELQIANTAEAQAERARVQALPSRERIGFEIESAALEDGRRIIRGTANTFGVMRSGRMMHPGFFEDFLAANPNAAPPILANHGYVSDFATIGKVTGLKVSRTKGLAFTAELATGIDLADKAWTLVQQGMLATLSIGWSSRQARWVSVDDKDIDPFVAKKLKEAGVTGAYVFFAGELLEISLVDVPDDGGATLAASIEAAISDKLERLLQRRDPNGIEPAGSGVQLTQEDVDRFHEELKRRLGQDIDKAVSAAIAQTASSAAVQACRAYHEANATAIQTLIVDTIESALAERDGDYAAGLLADTDGDGEAGCAHAAEEEPHPEPATPSDTSGAMAGLLERVRKINAKFSG